MKKLVILMGIAILALLGATGTTLRGNRAEARPTDISAINP